MVKIDVKTKVVSLKSQIDYDTAEEMVDSRKVKLFQTLLHKPKKSEIHLHSLTLHLEAILLLSENILLISFVMLIIRYL